MNDGTGGAKTILVVEDNLMNLTLVRAVLQRAGYRTEEAHSAEEAFERLSAVQPDVILLDIQLPGQDGLSFARQVRGEPSTAKIPIVALTAHAMDTDRERALDAGCNGYIAKPINTRTFVDELAAILQESASAPGGQS